MSGNDLLTRNIKVPFGTDWVYIVNQAGLIEGRAAISDIVALGPGQSNTSSNVGTGAPLAKAKIGDNLPFRTLVSADGSVEFVQNTDEINLKANRVGVYRNIYIAAGAMIGNFTNGASSGTFETPINDVMNDYYEFPAGVDSFAQFSMMMPDEWDLGTLKFKFFWTNAAVVGAGSVTWGMSADPVSDGESVDTPLASTNFTNDDFISSGDMHIAGPAAVPSTLSPALQDIIYFRVTRSAVDTYTESARLLGVAIQYKELVIEPVEWT